MSFVFNNTPYTTLYFGFLADNTFNKYYGANKSITYFEGGNSGDYVNICGDRSKGTKPNRMYVNISQIPDNGGAGFKIKIPLFNNDNGGNYYNPDVIMDAVIISDETNGFTQSGFIEWEMPLRYGCYGNLRGKSKWYSWQIVLENLGDTVTPMKADIRLYDYAVEVTDEGISGDELTFEKIHNYLQTIDTSLSIKNNNQYFFNCGIHINGGYFKSKSEQISFGRNFDFYMRSYNAQYGELSYGKAINGTSIKFNCYNSDFGGLVGYTSSKIYGLNYETIYETGSVYNHGHWGAGLGSSSYQDINGLSITRMRSVSMTPTDNVILSPIIVKTHIEPIGAIIDGGITINYDQGTRTSSNKDFQYMHNYNFTAVKYKAIQNRGSGRYADTQNYFVDCKYNPLLPYCDFQLYSSGQYYNEQKTNIVYSMIIKTITKTGIPIDNVNVKLLNKNGVEVFNGITNINGYATELQGTITTASNTQIIDSNEPFPAGTDYKYNNGLYYRELIMTSGKNKDIKKIIKKYNTTTICETHTPYLQNVEVGDNFIKVPYITSVINTIDTNSNSYYKPCVTNEQGPFTLKLKKGDYIYSEILNIHNPINKTIVLEKKKTIINTDLENLN